MSDATPKVFIAVPTRGEVRQEHASSVYDLLHTRLEFGEFYTLPAVQMWSQDVVRTRSRLVDYFLHKTDCTHILFLDADCTCTPYTIMGMLQAKKDFVTAPYPKRGAIDWERVTQFVKAGLLPEAGAYLYNVGVKGDGIEFGTDGCGEVDRMPLGCALLTREGLQWIWDTYKDELLFREAIPWTGEMRDIVALFHLMFVPNSEGPPGYLGEDYSFCKRWRDAGGKVWLYMGPGSPVDHYGAYAFHGMIEAFGLKHNAPAPGK